MFTTIEIGAARALFDEMDIARKLIAEDLWNITSFDLNGANKTAYVDM